MEFRDVVDQRRSIRHFYPKPIEIEKIGALIQMGSKAPSAGDLQPWKFIIITKARTIQTIADACPYEKFLYQAPLIILICSHAVKTEMFYPGKGKLWAAQSCAAAAQNMLLGAVDLGLSGCWVSAFETAKIKETLHVPDGVDPEILLAIGYPDETPGKKRNEPFDTHVFFNDYGAQSTDIHVLKRDYGLFVREKIDDAKQRAAQETAEHGSIRTGVDSFREKISNLLGKKQRDKHEGWHEGHGKHDPHNSSPTQGDYEQHKR
jgi:nitroreductase